MDRRRRTSTLYTTTFLQSPIDVLFLFQWCRGGERWWWWWRSFHLVWTVVSYSSLVAAQGEILHRSPIPADSFRHLFFKFFFYFPDWSFDYSFTYILIVASCVCCFVLVCRPIRAAGHLHVTQKPAVVFPFSRRCDDKVIFLLRFILCCP